VKNRSLVVAAGLVALVVLVAVGWYLLSPLWINRTVDEAFPFDGPSAAEMADMPTEEMAAVETTLEAALPTEAEVAALDEEARAEVEEKVMEAAAVMPEQEMDEPMPAAEPVVVLQGSFVGADDFHQGSGNAVIYQLPDGSHVLRFEDFSVTNGPDLHVILSGSAAPATSDEVMAGYVDLGSLKGNIGNQNYEIPAGTDVSQIRSVVIYCQPFQVVFAVATLQDLSSSEGT
jgi:hypothetical protein